MQLYPLPLRSGQEAMLLDGVGKFIADKLDELLAINIQQQQQHQRLQTTTTTASTTSNATSSTISLPTTITTSAPASTSTSTTTSVVATSSCYVPRAGSSAWCLLVALHDVGNNALSKEELLSRALKLMEELSASSSSSTSSSSTVLASKKKTLLSNAVTLATKGLITKSSNDLQYRLSQSGRELAATLKITNTASKHSNGTTNNTSSNIRSIIQPAVSSSSAPMIQSSTSTATSGDSRTSIRPRSLTTSYTQPVQSLREESFINDDRDSFPLVQDNDDYGYGDDQDESVPLFQLSPPSSPPKNDNRSKQRVQDKAKSKLKEKEKLKKRPVMRPLFDSPSPSKKLRTDESLLEMSLQSRLEANISAASNTEEPESDSNSAGHEIDSDSGSDREDSDEEIERSPTPTALIPRRFVRFLCLRNNPSNAEQIHRRLTTQESFVMLLDTREIRGRKTSEDRAFLASQFQQMSKMFYYTTSCNTSIHHFYISGLPCIVRALPLGDILWVAKLKPGSDLYTQFAGEDQDNDEVSLNDDGDSTRN